MSGSTELHRALLSLRSSVLLLDDRAVIRYANPALEYRNGFSVSEAFEHNPSDLWGKRMPRAYYARFWKTLLEQGKLISPILNMHANGRELKESLYIVAVPHQKTHFYLELQPPPGATSYRRDFDQVDGSRFASFKLFFEAYFGSLEGVDGFDGLIQCLTTTLHAEHGDRLEDRAITLSGQSTQEIVTIFFDKYYSEVLRYFKRKVNASTAEDLTQDVFLLALRSFARYRPDASYKTYLLRLAHNRYVDFLRAQSHAPEVGLLDRHGSAIGDPSDSIDWALVVDGLAAKERELLTKHYLEGYKLRDIAQSWQVSENAVKLRISRLRKRLQDSA